MKFTIATIAALASVVVAQQDPPNSRQNFEFQNFQASCSAVSDQCTFTFSLNGHTPCSGSQPAFKGTKDGATYKKLPNIGVTRCSNISWSAARGADGNFMIFAKEDGARGVAGNALVPAGEFAVKDGLEAYIGTGIVILFGEPVPAPPAATPAPQ